MVWCRRNPATAALTASVAALLLLLSLGSTAAAVWLRAERDAARDATSRALSSEQGRLQQLYRAHLNDARSSRAAGQRERGQAVIRDILKVLPPEELSG